MELQQAKPTPMYWQSLEELQGDPEALEASYHEFQKGVTDDFDINQMSGISRRRFLAAMSASAAFALTSCKNYLDKGEIIPYNNKPEEVTVGRPNYYASTVKTHNGISAALIKTREGRPIFISGNPEDPVSKGRIGAHYQAQIMALYDPERLLAPAKGQGQSSWQDADSAVVSALKGLKGQKAVVLAHKLLSPTAKLALDDFLKAYPGSQALSYTLFNDNHRNQAWKASHGGDVFPAIAWDQADVILALEADFLGAEGDDEMQRLFASRRDVMTDAPFNRLYVAEGQLSTTGMAADYRLRLRPDAQLALVLALAKELGVQSLGAKGSDLKQLAQSYGLNETALKNLVADLGKNKGKVLVYAGSRLPQAVHLAVNALNDALGAGALYRSEAAQRPQLPIATDAELKTLVEEMKAGKVGVLIHWDTNPVYHLAALGYGEALAKVPVSVLLSTHNNETGAKSTYTLPIHHDLEAWGDYQPRASVRNLQQPVVSPLHDSRQAEGLLLAWAAGDGAKYSENLYLDYLKAAWKKVHTQVKPVSDFTTFWTTSLQDGFVPMSAPMAKAGAFKAAALSALPEAKAGSDFVVTLLPGHSTGDGQFADNGWLQEIPHPVSKVVWDNYAAMSVATAKELGVSTEDKVQISVGNASVELPVLEQPGMADKVIAVDMGYGRTQAGTIGNGVGVDVSPLLAFGSDSPWIAKASVSKVAGSHHLVTTQLHHRFNVEREQDLHFSRKIVHEANYLAYQKNPESAKLESEMPENINKAHAYPGIKWAMAIDMNKCSGCNACIVACNIENNVPVVGPDQVDRGREMHWMRLDRYYSGPAEDPKVSLQMMLCQHCDNAPCEIVCPVNATNHSPDGLNQMAYNRCVGTRYCSNNCPYKVRRFNFFDYRDRIWGAHYRKETFHLMHNPEVTVRSRGVMEKCTFCVQRIMWARQEAIR
ncbi:MAG: TAT-variant-translocated molybdopterin oxidoreductase, partial [Candidatus Sericytochromatia bacterium]